VGWCECVGVGKYRRFQHINARRFDFGVFLVNSDSLDVASGVALGVFLITVVVKGNSKALVTLAERDKSFLKWAIALGVLFYLRGIGALKGPITELIAASFIGLFLVAGDKIIPQAKSFWQSIGG